MNLNFQLKKDLDLELLFSRTRIQESMCDHKRLLLWQCTALIFIRTVNNPPPLMQNIHHRCCAEEYVPLPLGGFTERLFDLIVLSYSLGIFGTGEHAKFYLDQTTCVQLLRKSLSLKSISLLKWTDIDCSIYSHVS